MKKIVVLFTIIVLLTGCTNPFDNMFNKQMKEMEAKVSEMIKENKPINIGNLNITVNSVTKKNKECKLEGYDGECVSYEDLKGDFFLIIDVSIENNSKKDFKLTSSSVALRAENGEAGELKIFSDYVKSDLLTDVFAGAKLKGQVVFDVIDSNSYTLYLEDFFKNFDSKAKVIIEKSDIIE